MIYRNNTTKPLESPQAGFTIIELLIATTVFSMVLMVLLYGVLSFTHAYYSGVNSSTTQDATRTVINTVAQAVEFSGNTITPTPASQTAGRPYYFCAGGNTYYFILGSMYDGATPSSTDPGLFMDPGICTATPNFSATGAKEMLGANMRVTYLNLAQSATNTRLYTVSLGIAYGAADLLCNVSQDGHAGGCLPGDTVNGPSASVAGTNANDVVCKQAAGSQFCAHAGLSTTVSLRVSNGALAS